MRLNRLVAASTAASGHGIDLCGFTLSYSVPGLGDAAWFGEPAFDLQVVDAAVGRLGTAG